MKELSFDFETMEIEDELPEILDEILQQETKETKPSKRKRVTKNYINNEDFCAALVKYKEDCAEAELSGKKKPRIPDYIGVCFDSIAKGLAQRPNFFGYSYKDEMIADGVENCLMYFDNFDVEKGKNPFAYFTQIIWWCFVRRIQKEKRQQYIKYKLTEDYGIMDSSGSMEFGEVKQNEVYENMYEFIRKFEETELNKTKKVILGKQKKIAGIEKFLEE